MVTLSPNNSTSPWSIVLPYSNETHALQSIAAPSWVGTPNIRGTSDILQSCIMTLVACIYTALHLNVPKKSTVLHVLWVKFKWMVITLFAPEFVLFMALDQFLQAWMLRRKLRAIREESEWKGQRFDIDLKYAFFVVMGGIHVEVDDILSPDDLNPSERILDTNGRPIRKTARLSPKGVVRLAKRRGWLRVESNRIDDKNKSNYFQKFLVVTQVSWMVVQCITRKYYNFPLTLLEIHTMVHVACALFLYIFWLKKPHDVQDPEVFSPIAGDYGGEIALMVQQQYYSQWAYNLAIFKPLQDQYQRLPQHTTRWVTPEEGSTLKSGDIIAHNGLALISEDNAEVSLNVSSKFIERWRRIFESYTYEELAAMPHAPKNHGMRKWKSSGHLPLRNDDEQGHMHWADEETKPPLLHRLAEFKDHTVKAPRKMPFGDDGRNLNINLSADTDFTNLFSGGLDGALIFLLMILSAVYGAVHVYAWNWNFPTEIEQTAWQISCLVTIGLYPVFYLITVAVTFVQICFNASESSKGWTSSFLLLLSLGVYVAARVYIVGGAFASLRLVPIGVYISPEWLELFPHF